nr:hypothetical protein [Tanacetum cinerariifolium]
MSLSKDKVTKGCLGFARALIEVTAEKELKNQVTMVVPMVTDEGYSMAKMDVVYEWKPSRCDECLVFGYMKEQCPKRVSDTPKKIVAVQNDGFTTVVNRKNKGKATASQKKHAGGFKVSNTQLVYQLVKPKENASMPSTSDSKRKEQELEENGENNNGIKLRNLFDKLNDISYQVDPNSDMGEVGITSDKTKPDEESDSEVEEVFRNWDWISNASLCDKGCQIILSWNKDLVDVLLLTQTSQVVHTKVLHKAEDKVLYCSFIYVGNKTIERRTLWADLDLHKYVVRDFLGSSWRNIRSGACYFMDQQHKNKLIKRSISPHFLRSVVRRPAEKYFQGGRRHIYATGSESRPLMLNKENYVPWSSRLLRYAKSRPNGKLIHNSILNGPYVRKIIPEPGDANREITVSETFHLQTDDELSDKELKQIEADDQAIQTILLGLPEDIYAAIDSYETAQEIWLRPEWSRHVTIVHQTKDLHTADYTQLYEFLKYNQKEVDKLKAERLANTQDPLALMANSNNPYKEEEGIQLQAEEYNLMAAAADLDEIEEVNANCILMVNLQQASTSGTQTDSAPVYDTDGSAEVHENCNDNEIFNMFTQEEQYTELLEPIFESHQVPQNDNDVISEDTSVEQDPSNSLLRDEDAVYIQAFNDAKFDEEIEVITNSTNVVVTGNEVPDVFVAHYESFLVSNDEIKRAMFDIGDGKSPGPDGYTSAFFKKGWDVVGSDVCRAVRDFFDNGKLLKEVNHTFLALIPKGIKDVVSENQSAFVPGRRISDNILLTQELMHNYHQDHGQPRCAFKVDIQKAYDTVDWRFL